MISPNSSPPRKVFQSNIRRFPHPILRKRSTRSGCLLSTDRPINGNKFNKEKLARRLAGLFLGYYLHAYASGVYAYGPSLYPQIYKLLIMNDLVLIKSICRNDSCTHMPDWHILNGFGDPGRTRTPNILIRSQVLYPVELRDRGSVITVRKTVRKPRLPA